MDKGFTLIELLIVVAIIGILAAVGAAVIPNLLNKTKDTVTENNHDLVVSTIKKEVMEGRIALFEKFISSVKGDATEKYTECIKQVISQHK